MTLYRYKAIGKEGILQKGVIEAATSSELKVILGELGFSLVTYSRQSPFLLSTKVKPRTLLDLCFHLEQFENAGIPLKESLNALYQAQSSPKLKSALIKVIQNIEGGALFSKALEQYSSIFDAVFVGLIAAGEKTGQLSSVLPHLLQHLKWKDEVQAQTLKALRYPSILAVVLFGLIFFLMTTLVPELLVFVNSFSQDLPPSTLFLIRVSGFLSTHFFLILISCGLSLASFVLFLKFHPRGSLWKEHFLDLMPVLGSLRRNLNMARFCHIFAVLFGSGIDILQALKTARLSLKEGQMRATLERIEILVKEGLSLSEAFQRVGYFPFLIIRMVKIGEQTSSLQKSLFHVKHYFDASLKRQVDHLMGLIEPCMILIVGLVMGWIIYSVFLPLYDILSVLDY